MTTSLEKTVYYPTYPFARLVDRYEWYEAGYVTAEITQTVYPNFATGFQFFFYRDRPVLARNDKVGEVELPEACLLPPTTLLTRQRCPARLRMLRVIFHPGALARLYKIKMNGLQNELAVHLKEIDHQLVGVHRQMELSDQNQACIQQFEQYLLDRVTAFSPPSLYRKAAAVVRQLYFKVTVQGLADALGRSKRHLNRLMNRELGFSAKQFLRIHRFQAALRYLRQGQEVSLSQVAYEFGYCDQAHFSHEFKRMTGSTPRQYLRRSGEEALVGVGADNRNRFSY